MELSDSSMNAEDDSPLLVVAGMLCPHFFPRRMVSHSVSEDLGGERVDNEGMINLLLGYGLQTQDG